MKYPHLEKAPITEALIDIQVKLPESLDIEVFLELGQHLSSIA